MIHVLTYLGSKSPRRRLHGDIDGPDKDLESDSAQDTAPCPIQFKEGLCQEIILRLNHCHHCDNEQSPVRQAQGPKEAEDDPVNLCYRCKWMPRISETAQKPVDEVVKYKDYHAYSRLLEEEADHEVDVEVVVRSNVREGKDPGDYIRQDPSR